MYSNGKNTLVNAHGDTDDIIREVFATFNDEWRQCYEVAPYLKGDTEIDTCRNIFNFVLYNVAYKEDPAGQQLVKTPGRLYNDGVGDCKSMAIMAASCCRCLDIPCIFRFVAFGTENVTHVYVVTKSGIIIDPVERVNGKPKFNYAGDFTKKIDMETTSIYRLSGIGASTDVYEVWMNGTCFIDNTFALNYLYSEIDMLFALLSLNENDIETLNACDRVVVALKLYEKATGSPAMLNRAANILQRMQDEGKLYDGSVDDESRAAHLQEIIDYALDKLTAADDIQADGAVNDWFTTNISEQDFNNVSAEIKSAYKSYVAQNSEVSGIGAVNQNELCTKVQESAGYFLYYFLSNDFIEKYDKQSTLQLRKKRSVEQRVYTGWVKEFVSAGISRETVNNWLYAGFVKKYGETPEEMVLISIQKYGGSAKVGDPITLTAAAVTEIIIAVVSAVISAIVAIITACINAKYTSIENYPSATPSEDDFGGFTSSDTEKAKSEYEGGSSGLSLDSTSTILIAAVGITALMLFSSK